MTNPYADAEGLVRRDHQATSKAAALDVYPRSGTQRRAVLLRIYREGDVGMTRDEVAAELDMSPNTARPRIKELIDAGWVEANGQVRPTPLGRAAEVLVTTNRARAAILADRQKAWA